LIAPGRGAFNSAANATITTPWINPNVKNAD
jgi:hypothetical protein